MDLKSLLAAALLALSPIVALAAPTLVRIETSVGTMTVTLYADKAPKTVANFLEYVYAGHFDGTVFHRVIPGFMIQGGGYDEALFEKPTRDPVENESRDGLSNTRGTLAMARAPEPHSARAQFYINVADNTPLDAAKAPGGWGYTVFGKVIDGMAVADEISTMPTGPQGRFVRDVPQVPVIIHSIRYIEAEKDAAAP